MIGNVACNDGVGLSTSRRLANKNHKTQEGTSAGRPTLPVSPLLFVIVTDYLSRLVMQAVRNKRIELYTYGGVVVESYIMFADDIVFFCQVSHKSM